MASRKPKCPHCDRVACRCDGNAGYYSLGRGDERVNVDELLGIVEAFLTGVQRKLPTVIEQNELAHVAGAVRMYRSATERVLRARRARGIS